ncbi:amino acid ABC transporter permease [Actinobacillus pleuropneumoniae]|uniref:Amino acid ABC transporter permease n=1 Tax=Actinobacillus pleuropneumoniae TaxID=715 RepID=A0A9Q4DJ88_ACTPL|nr:amino acid ABC transporter permease [Actinobacillus pleuropneumoniae]KIE89117.1 putative amino-acid ABC transporter permease protein [Actinobacillus pleuropneumoniae]KIE89223.1 putative amino-acid ABC transporter permease protein [Actinobacillus pleuropneumoniae]KIE89324.1 putative amino-acid ABC transporter permease protein [Actinobacillus pleuropneumoniae]KIE95561.1 putative amino-acid ABC transporter permease protein [Actinobacillus pleuropneumoniae]KIE95794.1 putative amino-acid ABC tra
MLENLLLQIPFMDEARVKLVMDAFFPMVEAAVLVSIPLAIASFIIGMAIAVGIALIRVTPVNGMLHRIAFAIVKVYISIIRGTPMLVQISVVFYGLPAIGVYIDPIPAAIIGFSLNIGAYGSETVRAAISSVPKGQWEAGYTIGMTYMQTFRRIIAPQAIRVVIPPLSNTFIGLFKDTSLASVVTVTEMFRVAQQMANMSYDFLPVYIEAGLIYWCFCWVLFLIQAKLERRFNCFVAK